MVSSVMTVATALSDPMSCPVLPAVTLSSADFSRLWWQLALLCCLLSRPGWSGKLSPVEQILVRVLHQHWSMRKIPCHFYLRSKRDRGEVGVWCCTCVHNTYTVVTYSSPDWVLMFFFLKIFYLIISVVLDLSHMLLRQHGPRQGIYRLIVITHLYNRLAGLHLWQN